MTTDTDELLGIDERGLEYIREKLRGAASDCCVRLEPDQVRYITSAVLRGVQATERSYEGRPAVDGKPLELMTRDELLWHIRHSGKRDAMPAEQSVGVAIEALRSIAANTCCGKCQEAALVAKSAIAALNNTSHKEG
jgi:hypothetical protein